MIKGTIYKIKGGKKMIKKIILIIITVSVGVFFGFSVQKEKKHVNNVQNQSCYTLIKATHKSDFGVEYFNAVITFSFYKQKGAMTVSADLITKDNKTILLTQNMNFNYEHAEKNKYNLKIMNITNKNLYAETQSITMSSYMRNIITTYFSNPENIIFDIVRLPNDDLLFYQNVIPWFYCNKL